MQCHLEHCTIKNESYTENLIILLMKVWHINFKDLNDSKESTMEQSWLRDDGTELMHLK